MLKPKERTEDFKRTGRLPIREIRKATGASVKTLDRYRKYLVAVIILLSGDFPHLAEYLKPFREEGNR